MRLEIKNWKTDINREAAKISALSSAKIDKYEYVTGEEILLSDGSRIIEQTNFIFLSLGKTMENNWRTRKKQVEVLEVLKLIPKNYQLKMWFQKINQVKKLKMNLIKLKKPEKR